MASSPSIPTTMRAWTYTHRGPPEEILALRTLPIPVPGPNELLIRVSHVGLNAGMLVKFMLFPHFSSAPSIPEIGFSGVVAASGPVVKPHGDEAVAIGDEVVGVQWSGTLSEYVVASRSLVATKPTTLSLMESAVLPGCGMTAVQACDLAGVKKGDKVLVTGASGGLGSILLQYVKSVVGAEAGQGEVVVTCSSRNEEMVRAMGADEVIDYTKHPDLSEYLAQNHESEPFDAIFDVVGDAKLHKCCAEYLKENGMFVSLGALQETGAPTWWSLLSWVIPSKLERYRPLWLGGVPRNHRMYNGVGDLESLKRIVRMIDERRAKVAIDSVWNMEDVPKAYKKLQTQRGRGKIIAAVVQE